MRQGNRAASFAQAREGRAEAAAEAEAPQRRGDLGPAGLGDEVDAQQGGGPLHGRPLGEVDDVDGRPALADQALEELADGLDRVLHLQGDGAHGVVDDGDLAPRALAQVAHEEGDVAQGGGHEHHLRPGQLQERHLPGPTALEIDIVVKLVQLRPPVSARRKSSTRTLVLS